MENSIRILVIIVTWNKKAYVMALLNALKKIDYPKEAIDILVVDNASVDDTCMAIKTDFPDVKIISNSENLGGSGGFNTGLRWAFNQPKEYYKYLWLLDNDVLVHPGSLNELVQLLEEAEDAGIAGSTMMEMNRPWRVHEMGVFIDYHKGKLVFNLNGVEIDEWSGCSADDLPAMDTGKVKQSLSAEKYLEVDYVAAASLLVRADVARAAGLWEDYFLHYDDIEWCLRIRKMGYRVLVSSRSFVWHYLAAAQDSERTAYYNSRNILFLFNAYGPGKTLLKRVARRIYIKALICFISGKSDLGRFHLDAVDDFLKGKKGKKDFHIQTENKRYSVLRRTAEILKDVYTAVIHFIRCYRII